MRSPAIALVFVLACGARTSTPPPHRPPPTATPRTAPDPAHPSEADCDTLYAHAFELAIADRQPPPPAADRDALRTELRPAFVADCRGGTRAYHQCGLAATSRAELEACRR